MGADADGKAIADAAYALWSDTEAQRRMLMAQRENTVPDSADRICRFIVEHYSRNPSK